jgi:hypothetical protein
VDGTYAITHGNGQINYGTNLYFNAAHGIAPNVWLYPASDASGASAAIIATVSDGVSLYNYTAHCGHDGHADPSFVTSDIAGLANYHKYVLGIGNCCLANTFDESTPCFGEAFLQVSGKGGIGYIGATDNTLWDEDYWWGVGSGPVVGSGPTYEQTGPGAYDGIFHDHGEPESAWFVVNGAINYAGNMGVSDAGSSNETYYWEAYHLMGDPSLMTYLGVPDINNVTYDPTLLMTATEISVTADPASYIGITFDGDLIGAGYTGTSGSATIPLSGLSTPGIAEIVVTSQFKQPYIDSIQVIAPDGPYIVYDYSTYAESAGNGNGVVDAGEGVVVGLGLKNVGPDTAYDVTANITSTDPYITITDNTEPFGDIAGDNGTGYVSDGYALTIASNAPDGHRAPVSLEVTGIARENWFGSFQVLVHAPVLEVAAVSIDDSNGDNNGILDPGETADITLTIRNTGTGQAFDVDVVISETDQYVTLGNSSAYYGAIDSSGGTANNAGNRFGITADADCPLGYAVPIAVAVAGDNGLSANLAFNVTVGDRVAFYVDDFAYDMGWTGLGGTAEWQMGSPTGAGGDPSADHSPTADNRVLGNDVNGTYSSSISTTQWAYSPLIDCGSMSGVEMTYFHWLGVESSSYDHAYFDVFDGSTWVRLYQNSATLQETSWLESFYDLSTVADSNPNFQLRFGFGPTDGSGVYSGWNIDDIQIKGYGRVGQPDMEMTAGPFADTVQPDGSASHTLVAHNTGAGTLRVWFESSETWLEFPTEMQVILPGDSAIVNVDVNCQGLTCGTHDGTLHYTSNDAGTPEGDVAFSVLILAPDIDIQEPALVETLEAGQQSTYPLTITNNGPGRLDFAVASQMFSKSKAVVHATSEVQPVGYRPVDTDKGDPDEPLYAPTEKGFGGPDTWGHWWMDSDESGGPALDWVDISAVGTAVTLGDDASAGPITIGFPFPLYDSVYSSLYIGSNGLVAFDGPVSSRVNGPLPSTQGKAIIAMWWDDLDPRKGGQIMHYYDAANGRFIVSFDQVKFYYSTTGTGSLSFQVHLYADGTIRLHYGTMDPGVRDFLSATIGIQNSTQTDALQIVANAAYMHSNLAIEVNSSNWLSTVPAGGSITPFGSAVIQVAFDASDLEDGAYTGQLSISSNDPDSPSWVLPVTLNIQPEITYVCGDVNGNGVAATIDDLVYLVDYMFQSGPPPPVMDAVDVDTSPGVNISDLIYLVDYMFNSGPAPNCVQ